MQESAWMELVQESAWMELVSVNVWMAMEMEFWVTGSVLMGWS